MARRRSHGTGSISLHKSGKYLARFVLGYKESGTPILKSKTFVLKPDAERWLAEMKLKHFGITSADFRMTVAEWYELWLDDVKQNRSVNTYRGYKTYVGKYAIPYIGHLELNEDNRLAVKRWATQIKQTVTPDTYARAVRNTSTMFNMAIELGKAQLNPVVVIKDAKKPKPRFRKKRWKWLPLTKKLRSFIVWIDDAMDFLGWMIPGAVIYNLINQEFFKSSTTEFFEPVTPAASNVFATVTNFRLNITPANVFFGIFIFCILAVFGPSILRVLRKIFGIETSKSKKKKSKSKSLPRLSP